MNLGEIGMNSLLWSPMNGKSWPKFKEKEEEEEEEEEEGGRGGGGRGGRHPETESVFRRNGKVT